MIGKISYLKMGVASLEELICATFDLGVTPSICLSEIIMSGKQYPKYGHKWMTISSTLFPNFSIVSSSKVAFLNGIMKSNMGKR